MSHIATDFEHSGLFREKAGVHTHTHKKQDKFIYSVESRLPCSGQLSPLGKMLEVHNQNCGGGFFLP